MKTKADKRTVLIIAGLITAVGCIISIWGGIEIGLCLQKLISGE